MSVGGHYCAGGGIIYPTTPCSAGYYCKSGAMTATPLQNILAYECPVGYYCPEQTAEPIRCPVGTYSNDTRLRNETDCKPCPKGKVLETYTQYYTGSLTGKLTFSCKVF